MKKIILLSTLTLLILYGFGQVERKNAKYMDTCSVNILSSENININAEINNTNQFKVECNCNLLKYNLNFFDRWGNNVITSKNIQDTLNFTTLKKGSYVWIIEAKYPNGKKDKKNGVINIITIN